MHTYKITLYQQENGDDHKLVEYEEKAGNLFFALDAVIGSFEVHDRSHIPVIARDIESGDLAVIDSAVFIYRGNCKFEIDMDLHERITIENNKIL